MEDLLFDTDLILETEESLDVNPIDSFSFDGNNFDYSSGTSNEEQISIFII